MYGIQVINDDDDGQPHKNADNYENKWGNTVFGCKNQDINNRAGINTVLRMFPVLQQMMRMIRLNKMKVNVTKL